MRRVELAKFYERALAWTEANSPVDDWAVHDPGKFERLSSRSFIRRYCWVIHASGFKVAVVEQHWNAIQETYQGFDLEKLAHMTVTKDLLEALPIAHNGKVQGFLDGCRIVRTRGWRQYKDQLRQELKRRGDEAVMAVLEELAYIGPITKYHLGMSIGLDVAKPDRWVQRTAENYNAGVLEMVEYLSRKYGHSRRYVDGIIFEYCRKRRDRCPVRI